MATKYVAAKKVAIGTDKPDPDREGFTLVQVFKAGEKVDLKLDKDTLEGLVANGYLKEA
jgi:hypothetical protein